jgi:SAM-dependent methyltransferase
MQSHSAYDSLAADYDVIIDWPSRLAREGPFIERLVERIGARTVLDVGGGTGHHARMLHEWGLEVTIADPSLATLDAVRGDLPPDIRLEPVGFDGLAPLGRFDLVVCLGNTIPHVAGLEEFRAALGALYGAVGPGGALLVHQINYEPILADFDRERFMPARGATGKFLLRFFEKAGERLRFVIMRVTGEAGEYQTEFMATYHTVIGAGDYREALVALGAPEPELLGGWGRARFVPEESDVLIVAVRRP